MNKAIPQTTATVAFICAGATIASVNELPIKTWTNAVQVQQTQTRSQRHGLHCDLLIRDAKTHGRCRQI